MVYEIGDTVVHWTHGIGKVVAIEERHLAGIPQAYYVVEVGQLMLWIQAKEPHQGSLRYPAAGNEFKQLISTLHQAGERLPDNPQKRKIELRKRIQERTLVDLCQLIRALTDHSRHHSLNQNDSAVLFRAEEYLLDEWVLSLGTDRSEALRELESILRADRLETLDRS